MATDEDLYQFRDLLAPTERDILETVRGVMRTEVASAIDDYWAEARFPDHLVGRLAATGLANLGTSACPGPTASSLLKGFVAAEMARVDLSFATFYGAHTGPAAHRRGRTTVQHYELAAEAERAEQILVHRLGR
jgi:glutaryl-CoA dehydrogenase